MQNTGNFWIDNGYAQLSLLWGQEWASNDPDQVLTSLAQQIYTPTGNQGEYYDKATCTIKQYNKRNWKPPTNLFISVSDNPEKVIVDGKTYYTTPPDFVSKIRLQLSKQNKLCDFCGKLAPTTDAKQYLFPFVIDPAKFGNFYGGLKRGFQLCAQCALAGFAGHLSWIWCRADDTYHFYLFHSDINKLMSLYRDFLRVEFLKEDSRGGNFEPPFRGRYAHEMLLAILLRLFQVLSARSSQASGLDILEELTGARPTSNIPWTLYAITGDYGGNSLAFRSVLQFDRFQRMYRLYEDWIAEMPGDKPATTLEQVFEQFQRRDQKRTETLWRNQIARAILAFEDPTPFVEKFLYDVSIETERPLRSGTLECLTLYLQEVLKMDEQLRKTIAGFGSELGRTAATKKEVGLLYDLRNAKNLDQYLNVLNKIQFTLGLRISERLAQVEPNERVAGTPWMRVKTLLAIYAMNAYLRATAPTHAQSQGEEAQDD